MSKHTKRRHCKKHTKSEESSFSSSSDAEEDRKKSKYISSDSSDESAHSPRSKSRSRKNSKGHRQKRRSSYSDSEVEENSRSKSPHDEKYRSRSQLKDGHHHHHHRRESSEDVPASYKQSNSNYLERHKQSDQDRSSDKKSHQDKNCSSSKRNESGNDRYDNRDHDHKSKFRPQREESPQGRYSRDRHTRRRRRSGSFDHAKAKWGKTENEVGNKDTKDSKEKEKPNFGLSGKLTEETNTYRGVVIKYSEPPEARKPKRRWRLYPFKGEKALQTLYIHRESGYLIGRERKVVDIPVDHPSCSKQHAALQYRLVTFTREDGTSGKRVRPYLIDLESANGTYINNKKIEARKYVELLEKDVIKFGYSSREYVLLHENSKDEAQDDDVKDELDEVAIKKEND